MKLGIVGAMDIEIDGVKKSMEIYSDRDVAGMCFIEGRIDFTEIVLVKCGVGKVNAAICTQILFDLFDVTHVVNIGVAGALQNDLRIGDVIVADEVMYHDFDVRALGYELGEIPDMAKTFKADSEMLKYANDAIERIMLNARDITGLILSGDKFAGSRDDKDKIRRYIRGECCEMEGGGVAQACYVNKKPFVVIRAISDEVDGYEDYEMNEKESAGVSAKIVVQMAKDMSSLTVIKKGVL